MQIADQCQKRLEKMSNVQLIGLMLSDYKNNKWMCSCMLLQQSAKNLMLYTMYSKTSPLYKPVAEEVC